jgi:hypothetical protein
LERKLQELGYSAVVDAASNGSVAEVAAMAANARAMLQKSKEDQNKAAAIYAMSIPLTTRQPRTGEVPGKDYHFVTKREFLAFVEAGCGAWFFLKRRLHSWSVILGSMMWLGEKPGHLLNPPACLSGVDTLTSAFINSVATLQAYVRVRAKQRDLVWNVENGEHSTDASEEVKRWSTSNCRSNPRAWVEEGNPEC